jgi:hypothetical protein
VKRAIAILVLALAAAACTSGLRADPPRPGRPEIAELTVEPRRVASGCPVKVTFTFEDAHADVVGVRAYWVYEGTGEQAARPIRIVKDGHAAVAVEPGALTQRLRGRVTTALTPLLPGHYKYTVQLEDALGQKSNVLEAWITVEASVPGAFCD